LYNDSPSNVPPFSSSDFGVSFYNGTAGGTTFNGGYTWGKTPDSFVPFASGQSIPSGGYRDFTFGLDLPNDVRSRTIYFYPDHFGDFDIANRPEDTFCPLTIETYQPYGVSIGAKADAKDATGAINVENPNHVDYETWIKLSGTSPPQSVNVPTSSSFTYYNAGTGGTSYIAGPVGGGSYPTDGATTTYTTGPATYPVGAVNAGDKYCANISAGYTSGWAGPGSKNVVDNATSQTLNPCSTIHNEPYVHMIGGDVSVGGGFEGQGACDSKGGIYTYFKSPGNATEKPAGSGVQIGALAINTISGFTSASLREPPRHLPPSVGLTFSNTVNVEPFNGSHDTNQGGLLYDGGTGAHCTHSYFSDKKESLTNEGPTSISVSGMTGEHFYNHDLEIDGGSIASGNAGDAADAAHLTIYVKGNVHITNKITYDSTSWSNPNEIPNFRLVVSGGSITIDNNVTQLDGLYVSEPDGANGGNIYTCQYGVDGNYNNVLSGCNNQLIFNGAVVSKQIFLLRSLGSVRNAAPGERLQNGVSRACSMQTTTVSVNTGDCAAEIFNFTPELYISPFFKKKPGGQTSGPGSGKFDYITSLSPVL
jgi:hypothetical protein